MKPTSFRTFSLRTLLVIVTLVAMAFGFVAENWHQQRLVDEVLRTAEAEGSLYSAVGHSDGGVFIGFKRSLRLSQDTARKIVEAKRIAWMRTERGTSPDVRGVLARDFVEEPVVTNGIVSDWHRNGKTGYRDGNVWDYTPYHQGYKRKPPPEFNGLSVYGPLGDIYRWPVIELVFWPYKKQMVFGVAIAVGFIGWVVARRWITKKPTLR